MEFASRIPQAPQPCYWRLTEKNEETGDGLVEPALTSHRERGGKFRCELRGKFGSDLTLLLTEALASGGRVSLETFGWLPLYLLPIAIALKATSRYKNTPSTFVAGNA